MRSKKVLLPVFVILCVVLGILVENNILFKRAPIKYAKAFAKVYQSKENELNAVLAGVQVAIDKGRARKATTPDLMEYTGILETKGLAVLMYEGGNLVFCSDNSLSVPQSYSADIFDSRLVNLPNGWYTAKYIKVWNRTLIGLIQIRKSFPYDNKYLVSGFQSDFNLPTSVKIQTWVAASGLNVFNQENHFLFSLQFPSQFRISFWDVLLPALLYGIAFFLFFLWLYMLNRGNPQGKRRAQISLIALAALIGLRVAMQIFHIPDVFFELDLFKPQMFAYSNAFSSLGDLALWVATGAFAVLILYRNYSFPATFSSKFKEVFLRISLSAALFLIWVGVVTLIRMLILNSSLAFDLNKLLFFDIYSLASYLIITLLLVSFLLCTDKLTSLFQGRASFLLMMQFLIPASLLVYLLPLLLSWNIPFWALPFFWGATGLMAFIRLKRTSGFNFSALVVIAFVLSMVTVFIIWRYSTEREMNRKKVLAVNMANEHDPIAEFVLRGVNSEILADSVFARTVSTKVPDIDAIIRYMRRKFFEGYFARYGIRSVTICRSSDSLYVAPDNRMTSCYWFFKNMIRERGTKLPESNFYYLDNQNGRISYLGWIQVKDTNQVNKVSVFVELESKLVSEKIGYPELLLDTRFASRSKLKEYSYAKYYKGKLISYSGDFPFNMSAEIFNKGQHSIDEVKSDGYQHLSYKPNRESILVISSPTITFFDWLVSLSYIFVFYFLIMLVGVSVVNFPLLKRAFAPNFRNKIQYAMMAVLLASLLLVGGGTIYFNLRQYHLQHRKSISEKIQSIYFELSYRFEQEDKLVPSGRMSDILNMMSVVFYSDVNVYDPDGNLISTSRPEIFTKGLIGTRLNPRAYDQLTNQKEAEVVIEERIGNLAYTSAYIPFYNVDNKLLGYINLPYFTRQEEHAREIYNMVIAVTNIYMVLMLITILLSVFMASKITMPLQLIQKRFSQIKLGQRYEKIDYAANDEIGGLVKEYNRMVTELEKSVALLARSERESAWREMAKQIAHEINNPLTPMKLSVQHLQRAWNDKSERFADYLERISQTLIEEIDNLSAIASEFSNFAKMPETQNESFDLVGKIKNIVTLFSAEEAKFELELGNANQVQIFADKEQMSRVLKNVIKNALQSVEQGKVPVVKIDLKVVNDQVAIRIKDNGKGIADEVREKLFSPSFTTKSGGTGLGLAIVKSIVESAHGTISCETSNQAGTTFLIEFPIVKQG